jgi:hypothetical protein
VVKVAVAMMMILESDIVVRPGRRVPKALRSGCLAG